MEEVEEERPGLKAQRFLQQLGEEVRLGLMMTGGLASYRISSVPRRLCRSPEEQDLDHESRQRASVWSLCWHSSRARGTS